MANLILFHEYGKYQIDGTIDLDTHTFKAMLSNVAPVAATNTVKADITEIAAGNGYTAGGVALTSLSIAETGAGTGIWKWTAADFSWTASGGSIGPFRYVVIYDDTPSSPADPLVGYLDYGAGLTLTDTNIFTVDIQGDGIIQVTVV